PALKLVSSRSRSRRCSSFGSNGVPILRISLNRSPLAITIRAWCGIFMKALLLVFALPTGEGGGSAMASMKKGRGIAPPARFVVPDGESLEAHAAHVRHTAAHRHRRLVFRQFADRRFGGDQKAGDRSRVLQGGADDLGRVDHAGSDEVFID